MNDSRAGALNLQMSLEQLVSESKEVLKIQKLQVYICQKDTGAI